MKDIIKIKIRGYHIDSYGHVNNTRYLEFLEEARWEMKDNFLHFFDNTNDKYGLVVVNNNIDYLAPAFLGNVIKIESWVSKIGTKSVEFCHTIYNDDSEIIIAMATAIFVFFNRKENKSEQMPKELIKNFNNLFHNKE